MLYQNNCCPFLPGSIVKVFRLDKMVYHFGIITDGGTVIDHTIHGIQERTLDEFTKGGKAICTNPEDSEEQRWQILERAYHALVNLAQTSYHLFKLNCEHFANWCRKGVPESRQVQVAMVGVGVVAFIAALLFMMRASR